MYFKTEESGATAYMLETISKDWKKPWFTEGSLQWPRNLSGREYNGMNALMLMLHCEKEGYTIPRFCTFDCVQRLNKPGKNGEELPRVSVLKGEKSFPVMLTTFTCIHKETKEKIKYDDYKNLSEDEKKEYNVYPKMQVFRVFNVAQTNLKEARPELWEKLEKENGRPFVHEGEMFSFEPVDRMIRDNLWICPIWKSHATLTLLAKQDLPTFGYNMIDPLKSWCWGSILFYPFKISRFS